ncbi:hypothetical protein MASSI9I_50843 [Massilia sp. 9I]|nr:hypothetical protein MASSI9I_50843 [Massilia sp. 9I]
MRTVFETAVDGIITIDAAGAQAAAAAATP